MSLPDRLTKRPFVRVRDVASTVFLAVVLAWNVYSMPWWWSAPFAVLCVGMTLFTGYLLGRRVSAQEQIEELESEMRASAGRAGLN